MSDTFLSKEDVAILTGAKIKSKQIVQLRKMGLPFWINALGVPMVPRSAVDGRPARAPVPVPKVVPNLFRKDLDGK